MSGNTVTPVAMSNYITPTYTFSPGPSGIGTINLSGISNFDIKRLVAIINQTVGEVIYSSANSSYNYTNVVGTTVTLRADTTGQSSTDILQIVYDSGYVVLDPTFPINVDSIYVSNEVEIKNDTGNPVPVSGPLTDAQLRATPVPVSISSSVELEIKNDVGNPVPVSGTVSANQAGTWNINNVTGTVSLPTGAATSAKQDTQSTQLTQIKNSIDALSLGVSAPQDVLGVSVSGSRNNQVEINFESAPGPSLITETFTGGGFVTITNGHSIYNTGAGTTSSAKVVTTQSVVYRPAHEMYSYFTAAFTAGIASSFQRIGIFDDNNGFYIGYEGTTFGISKRTVGVNTFTPRTSWSDDPLDGSALSSFTRNGVPEAINLAYTNLFRIRFAWLGSAPVLFEVYSPDGQWILFHTLKIPNSQYDPSIANPNLPLSLHVSKTAAGTTNLAVTSACWAGGTTSDYVKISDTLTTNTLASLTRSVITGQTTAGGGGFVNVKVNPSGALNVAATQDGIWNINNITGTVSLPTGAATLAAQNTGNSSLSSIDGKLNTLGQKAMTGSVPVAIASDQTAIPATQSGTWNINNVTGTVSLPTGAATLAAQNTGNASLSSIDGKLNTLGQKAMTGSVPVAIASDQSPVPVSQSGTWNINNISGTVNLPTGASTLAAQNTGNASLSSIDGKLNTLGQKGMSGSVPVVIASDQSAVNVAQSGTWNINNITGTVSLPTGAATLTAQNAGNLSLSNIDTKTPALGQATMAGSSPVVIASNQSNVPVEQKGAVVSNVNSTSALLNAGQTFTGVSEEVVQYGVINIVVRSNVNSAIDGLQFLFSTDNVNFYSSDEYTILAGKFKTYSIAPVARYFKVQYTNGAAAQAQFLLQTVYRQVYVKPSSHRLADSPSSQDDAEIVQSILVAKLPTGDFTNIRTTTEGNLITNFARNQKDVFDRLITVNPTQLKSYDHRITKHPDSFDEVVVGSATSVLTAATASVDMTTTTAATDSVVRQTFESFEYIRGNTQQGLFSLNFNDGPKANNIRYFGLGDSENGAFIGVDGTGFFVMRRSNTSGTVVDTKIYQSSFNQDKLDGTGLSGITLNLSTQNLFSISYSWIGTNAIAYGLIVGSVKYSFHIENVGNTLTTPWCRSGQLPLRFENTNTGITASSTTFKANGSAVYTFGSSKGIQSFQSVSSGTTAISISATDTVIAGVQLRPGLKYVSIEPASYQIMPVSGTGFGYYRVIFRPLLTGATWANQGDISQILTNAPTFTNGIIIQEGYVNLAAAGRIAVDIPATLDATLGYDLAGVPNSIIIVMRTSTGTGSVYFAGNWKEIY